MAPSVLAQTQLLFTIPRICMESSRSNFDLDVREVPFDLPQVKLSVLRSATHGDDPGVRWFLERVQAACRHFW